MEDQVDRRFPVTVKVEGVPRNCGKKSSSEDRGKEFGNATHIPVFDASAVKKEPVETENTYIKRERNTDDMKPHSNYRCRAGESFSDVCLPRKRSSTPVEDRHTRSTKPSYYSSVMPDDKEVLATTLLSNSRAEGRNITSTGGIKGDSRRMWERPSSNRDAKRSSYRSEKDDLTNTVANTTLNVNKSEPREGSSNTDFRQSGKRQKLSSSMDYLPSGDTTEKCSFCSEKKKVVKSETFGVGKNMKIKVKEEYQEEDKLPSEVWGSKRENCMYCNKNNSQDSSKRKGNGSLPERGMVRPASVSSASDKSDIEEKRERSNKKRKDKEYVVETDPEILARRQKQINYGKNTTGYQRYQEMVPKEKRTRQDPNTPPKYGKYSRRGWDGLIKSWRRKLHNWDPPKTAVDGESSSLRSSSPVLTVSDESENLLDITNDSANDKFCWADDVESDAEPDAQEEISEPQTMEI